MISGDLLDKLEEIAREIRENSFAWGGIQVSEFEEDGISYLVHLGDICGGLSSATAHSEGESSSSCIYISQLELYTATRNTDTRISPNGTRIKGTIGGSTNERAWANVESSP